MTREEELRRVLMTDNRKLNRVMLSLMKDETLHYLLTVSEDKQVGDFQEPYKSDVIDSYQKAREQS